MTELPGGTITFLFTDIEGSTARWEQQRAMMEAALVRHDSIVRTAVESHGGVVFKTVGDAFYAAFRTAPEALTAASEAQHALARETWPEGCTIRARMAVHTGTVEERDGDYFGPPLNRIARLLATGHGGQILLSGPARELVQDQLPHEIELRDLGEHSLKDLNRPERIYQVVAPELPRDFPPLRTHDAHPHNLPLQSTPFIGRERALAEIGTLVQEENVRLLTLTGTGGTGKTRLCLEVAGAVLERFPDGIWFVSLAALRAPDLVVSEITGAFHLAGIPGQDLLTTLTEYLRGREILLLLDNFEHLMEATGIVAHLLAGCPRLTIMITSRAPLHLSAEREYPVPLLDVPDPRHLPGLAALAQYDAVTLFLERAGAVKPDFKLNEENAPAIAEICHRLEGLPLALQLAAARVKLFSPQALLIRLDTRLQLLTGGARDLPGRQQTLRGTIAWSYDLLDATEGEFFRRACIFSGGFTPDAADTVCLEASSDVLDVITSLVDKSLLIVTYGDDDVRFSLLESIREFGLEQLVSRGEREDVALRHAAYFLDLAERAEPELLGSDQVAWMDRLEHEHDNVRAIFRWVEERHDAATGLRLGGALWRFWMTRGHVAEGQVWMERLLEVVNDLPITAEIRARAYYSAGVLAFGQSEFVVATRHLKQAQTLYREVGDKLGVATVLNASGVAFTEQGEYDRAREMIEESVSLYRELGDSFRIAKSLNNLANLTRYQGDSRRAQELYEESLNAYRAGGARHNEAGALNNLGQLAGEMGEYDRGEKLAQESLALYRELDDLRGAADALVNLGVFELNQGNLAPAAELIEEGIELYRSVGADGHYLFPLQNLGLIALHQGDHQRAEELSRLALGMGQAQGSKRGEAYALNNLGDIAIERQDAECAGELYAKSLSLNRAIGYPLGIAESLERLARASSLQSHSYNALRMYAEAAGLRAGMEIPVVPIDRDAYQRDLLALREALDEATYEEIWNTGWAAGQMAL